MTSLQGIMGGEYARRAGEAPAVCEAIATHYLPIPKTKPALAVSLADRLDSLVGLFAAGLAPTGTKDPFALRRAAIGVVQPLMEHALRFDLAAALHTAAKIQPIPVSEENLAQVQEFITGRLRVVLLDLGFRYDVVEAVLSAQSNDPFGAKLAAEKLTSWVARPDWSALLPAYARCVRILRSAPEEAALAKEINPAILSDPAEKALSEALQVDSSQPASIDEFLMRLEKLVPAITHFFDEVLVMAEDEKLRLNRLALVARIANLSAGLADLSKLEGF